MCFISQVAYEARLVEVRRARARYKNLHFFMQSERGCGRLAAQAGEIDARLG